MLYIITDKQDDTRIMLVKANNIVDALEDTVLSRGQANVFLLRGWHLSRLYNKQRVIIISES